MLTMASKKSSAKGSDRASALMGHTPSSTPASRMRWMFSATLNHRSVAQTCTPNSRRRKMDDDARPLPRSSTRMPGRKSRAAASHSVNQRELAAPLAFATIHSGLYREARGNRSAGCGSSCCEVLGLTVSLPHLHRPFGHGDAFAGCGQFLHEGRHQRRRLEARLQFAVVVEELRAPAAVMVEDFIK